MGQTAAAPTTVKTFDGSVISATITGLTAHSWTADANGVFHTSSLAAEWAADEAVMLAGHADTLTALQRLEGNAEAILDNTAAKKSGATKLQALREDLQREFDAIDAAMRMNQTLYGIDPTKEFNTYSYLKMEETLQANESLKELGYQGHGVNHPAAMRYRGFTSDFQNGTDNSTYYVGGGPGNGEKAIADFLDDDVLTHAPFPTVMHNGVLTQLNQNGNLENALTDAIAAANQATFTRVFVASDFSTNKMATGDVVLVPGAQLPPDPAAAPAGMQATFDGSFIATTITGVTAHTWTADATGLFHTTNLADEWNADEATMLAGHADTLTPLQRMEGNAEAVIDNTAASGFSDAKLQALREDLQREFDAIDAAMRENQTLYGIDPNKEFNAYTYLKMEETLQADETLKELGYQGHGVNNPPATRYDGFTTDFQNRTDGVTYYVGGGPGSGEKAIADFLDDDVLTHAPFPTVMHNGVLTQLNQNGNLENALAEAISAANQVTYTRVYVASDFSANKKAHGAIVFVPNVQTAPDVKAAPAGVDKLFDTAYVVMSAPQYASTGADPIDWYSNAGWQSGANPNAWFDTNFYLTQNPDVKAAGIDPLAHFESNGWREGRDPSLVFSDSKYLAANPDVAAAGMDPLLHYEMFGQYEGRATFLTGGTAAADPLIDTTYYDGQLGATLIPSGTAGAEQAAWSFEASGWQKGLSPDAWFDTKYYLSHNPDVAAAHVDPLLHYELAGWKEGRDPSAQFSTSKYLAANPDVKAAGMDPLLHYVEFGQSEGRAIYSV